MLELAPFSIALISWGAASGVIVKTRYYDSVQKLDLRGYLDTSYWWPCIYVETDDDDNGGKRHLFKIQCAWHVRSWYSSSIVIHIRNSGIVSLAAHYAAHRCKPS
jgi:hypothetical protein